mmetsp:Transcript_23582/g.46345  ORF Transcript_23582/g.46345 Transcript_23582/m.46345 type:complete len:341 (-) Transcript_23582:349-1371(-)
MLRDKLLLLLDGRTPLNQLSPLPVDGPLLIPWVEDNPPILHPLGVFSHSVNVLLGHPVSLQSWSGIPLDALSEVCHRRGLCCNLHLLLLELVKTRAARVGRVGRLAAALPQSVCRLNCGGEGKVNRGEVGLCKKTVNASCNVQGLRGCRELGGIRDGVLDQVQTGILPLRRGIDEPLDKSATHLRTRLGEAQLLGCLLRCRRDFCLDLLLNGHLLCLGRDLGCRLRSGKERTAVSQQGLRTDRPDGRDCQEEFARVLRRGRGRKSGKVQVTQSHEGTRGSDSQKTGNDNKFELELIGIHLLHPLDKSHALLRLLILWVPGGCIENLPVSLCVPLHIPGKL